MCLIHILLKIHPLHLLLKRLLLYNFAHDAPSRLSPTGISSLAKLKISQPFSGFQEDSSSGNVAKSSFARINSNLGLRLSPKFPVTDDSSNEAAIKSNLFGTITQCLVDSSKNAVKAVQLVKTRHVVSRNKRRYQLTSPGEIMHQVFIPYLCFKFQVGIGAHDKLPDGIHQNPSCHAIQPAVQFYWWPQKSPYIVAQNKISTIRH